MAGPVLAAAAAGLVLGSAPAPAAAAPVLVTVPCRATALTADLAAASSGETLRLAPSCRYVLTAALPLIRENLTILGEGATLERSYAPGTPDFTILTVWSGKVNIQRLNFRHTDSEYGGAIDNGVSDEFASVLTVSGGTFSDNTAGFGGAIYNSPGGTLIVKGDVFADDSIGIYNNFSPDPGRGQITVLKVTGSSFTGNGEGIYNFGNASVTGSTFTDNDSGIFNQTSAHLAVTDSDFSQNSRSGLLNEGDSTVTGGSFIRNSTPYTGGGIDNTSDGPTALTVTGTSFTGNTAGDGGGGIYNYDSAQVTGATFTGNDAAGRRRDGKRVVRGRGWFHLPREQREVGRRRPVQRLRGDGVRQHLRGEQGGLGRRRYRYHVHPPGRVLRRHVRQPDGQPGPRQHRPADGGGIYTVDTVATPGLGSVSDSGGQIRGNVAGGDGGGIFNSGGTNVSLSGTVVTGNHPHNCVPLGSVPGCTG